MGHTAKKDKFDNFFRQRTQDGHIKNCSTGYRDKGRSQIHHLLCVTCAQDKNLPKAKKSVIRECMKVTTWDIDKPPNVLGLPLKIAFYQWEKSVKNKKKINPWKNGKLPCHQVDHGMYIDDCKDKCTELVWNKARLVKKSKKCDDLKGKSIAEDLKKVSRYFNKFLKKRGTTCGGTKKAWTNRDTQVDWYFPFSMASSPTPRKCVKKAMNDTEKKNLAKIFEVKK